MRHPDRPYRWGNWIAVGVIVGQLVGMLSSPIHVDLRLQQAVPLLASAAAPGTIGAVATMEVTLRRYRPDPVDLADAPVEADEWSIGPGNGPSGEASSATAAPAPRPQPSAEGTSRTTVGASTATTATQVAPNGTTTSSTARPGTSATTTRPTPSGTAGPDDLGLAALRRPCDAPAALVATWVVTLRDEDAVRPGVLTAIGDLPHEQIIAISPTVWHATGTAGGLCLASALPGVLDISELPAPPTPPTSASGPTTSIASTSGPTRPTVATSATTLGATQPSAADGSTLPGPDTTRGESTGETNPAPGAGSPPATTTPQDDATLSDGTRTAPGTTTTTTTTIAVGPVGD